MIQNGETASNVIPWPSEDEQLVAEIESLGPYTVFSWGEQNDQSWRYVVQVWYTDEKEGTTSLATAVKAPTRKLALSSALADLKPQRTEDDNEV